VIRERANVRSSRWAPVAILLLALSASAAVHCGGDADYVAELEQWKSERQERLQEEDGWLTLVGLYWLEPGANDFGANPELPIVLSADGVPSIGGTFHLDDDGVYVEAAPGSPLTVNDEPIAGRVALRDDSSDEPDLLGLGRLRFHIIKRGERYGVRVKDPQSAVRLNFSGIDYFDFDAAFRLEATMKPFDEPLRVELPTAAGTTATLLAPGEVEFVVNGERHTMLPLVDEPGETTLWFIFSDRTSGKETYGFRYLYSELEEDGRVDLDFNYAYNPPCAFTPYATCTLPPKQNRLDTRIEAGERIYGHQGHP
jgi:uncharacterized protein (DUF1684 family)